MGSESGCNPACQKLLLCSGCAGQGLKVQARAQNKWIKDHHGLSAVFAARQKARLESIKKLVDECYVAIGINGSSKTMSLSGLGDRLIELSRPRPLTAQMTAYCIDRADQIENITEENLDDYLEEIGYAA
jgi:hypothetical protein